MRPTRSSLRRAVTLAAAGTLVAGSLLASPVQAAPASPASP
ncbi:serine protease, partial [Micromonospora globispora]